MAERETIAMWRRRMRWRLRGAWQWPTFVALSVVDGVLLARLPFAGGRASVFGCLLVAGVFNLIVIAVVGQVGGLLLRRRQRGVPPSVAADRAGTAGMVVLAGLLLAGGLAHRGKVEADRQAFALAVATARRYAAEHAPRQYRAHLDAPDTFAESDQVFRTCFHGADPSRDWCVVVRTDELNPVVRRDPDQNPNATMFGPDNPSRSGG